MPYMRMGIGGVRGVVVTAITSGVVSVFCDLICCIALLACLIACLISMRIVYKNSREKDSSRKIEEKVDLRGEDDIRRDQII